MNHLQTNLTPFHIAVYLTKPANGNIPEKITHLAEYSHGIGQTRPKKQIILLTSSIFFCKSSSNCLILSAFSVNTAFLFSFQEFISIGLKWLARDLIILDGSSTPAKINDRLHQNQTMSIMYYIQN